MKSETRVEVCVETMKNALKEASLRSIEKVFKPTLPPKNLRDRLDFARAHKTWAISDGRGLFLVMGQTFSVQLLY